MVEGPEPDIDRRFSALDRLYGRDGANRIRHAHVAVIGLGGVGSWAVEALARSGVGRLTLIDLDHIAESNINRQVHALTDTIGCSKVRAMIERIEKINPQCLVHGVEEFVTADNWPQILPEPVDAVLDACDQMHAKLTMALWSLNKLRRQSIFLSVGAAGGKRLGHLIDIADLSMVTHDPLMAQLRYRLRKTHGASKDGKRIGVPCVFSREAVRPPDGSCEINSESSDGTLNCHGYGSIVSVTATFGKCAAGWVMDQLATRSPKLSQVSA